MMFILERLFQSALAVLAVSVIVFAGIFAIGNPVDILISPQATEVERLEVIRSLGLDLPLWQQYLHFVQRALQGDLGHSFVFSEPALDLIIQRLPATLELALGATLLAIVFGIPLGLYAGLKPDAMTSKIILGASILGFSVPTFWVGLLLIMVFAVELSWLPPGGRGETRMLFGVAWSFLTIDGLKHMAMPALNLALLSMSMVIRLTSTGTREAMLMDYVRFARAKGISANRIVFVHVLKNIMIPVVTIVGLNLGSTIAFAVVTESIFVWPGAGKLLIDSIAILDRPVIVAYLMIMVLVFIAINLIVDLLYGLLDPRVRSQRK